MARQLACWPSSPSGTCRCSSCWPAPRRTSRSASAARGSTSGERLKRLGVPFVFGFFVLIPPQTWYGGRFNSGYTDSFWHYITSGDFLKWNIKDGGDYYGGFGHRPPVVHLRLLLIALIVAAAAAVGSRGRGAPLFMQELLAAPGPARLVAVGGLPPDGRRRDARSDRPRDLLLPRVLRAGVRGRRRRRLHRVGRAVPLAGPRRRAALSVWSVVTGSHLDALPDPSLERTALTFLAMLAAWLMMVGLLGCGKRYLDRTVAGACRTWPRRRTRSTSCTRR